MDALTKRTIGKLVDVDALEKGMSGELAMPDRQELDDAVLEMLGITDPAERQALRTELYAAMTNLYRSIRTAEKKMHVNRSRTARRGRNTAHSITEEIWESLEPKPHLTTPLDFASLQEAETIELLAGKAKIIEANLLDPVLLMFGKHGIDLKDTTRAQFAKAVSDSGITGPVRIPNDPAICAAALQQYQVHTQELEERFLRLAAERTADEKLQERIVKALRHKMQPRTA